MSSFEAFAVPEQEPIIISGGSPLKVKIQCPSHTWVVTTPGQKYDHSHPLKVRGVSFDYFADDRWTDIPLKNNEELALELTYGGQVVTINSGPGGNGLTIGGPLAAVDATTLDGIEGQFSAIKLTKGGQEVPIEAPPSGKARIAIRYH